MVSGNCRVCLAGINSQATKRQEISLDRASLNFTACYDGIIPSKDFVRYLPICHRPTMSDT